MEGFKNESVGQNIQSSYLSDLLYRLPAQIEERTEQMENADSSRHIDDPDGQYFGQQPSKNAIVDTMHHCKEFVDGFLFLWELLF